MLILGSKYLLNHVYCRRIFYLFDLYLSVAYFSSGFTVELPKFLHKTFKIIKYKLYFFYVNASLNREAYLYFIILKQQIGFIFEKGKG